jgi:hypothetical protein
VSRRGIWTALAVVAALLVLSVLGHPLLWQIPLALVMVWVAVRLWRVRRQLVPSALGFAAGAVAGLLLYMLTFGGPDEAFSADLLEEGGLFVLLSFAGLLGIVGAGVGYVVGYHRRRGRRARPTTRSTARGDRIPPRVGP